MWSAVLLFYWTYACPELPPVPFLHADWPRLPLKRRWEPGSCNRAVRRLQWYDESICHAECPIRGLEELVLHLENPSGSCDPEFMSEYTAFRYRLPLGVDLSFSKVT